MPVYVALMSRGEARVRGLVDEPLEILILSPPDIFADMVTRLTMRQAVKNCYDRGKYYLGIASRALSRRR